MPDLLEGDLMESVEKGNQTLAILEWLRKTVEDTSQPEAVRIYCADVLDGLADRLHNLNVKED